MVYLNNIVALMLLVAVSAVEFPHPLSDEFIDLINSQQDLWVAGRNYPEDTSIEYLLSRFGTILTEIPEDSIIKDHDDDLIASLPESFDARGKWPSCSSINEIRDQGNCGSCWAHGATEAMTDRWCIHSNASENFHFSVQDLTSCAVSDKCDGGEPILAWKYWNTDGIVSGGNYQSGEYCQPYKVGNCRHPCPPFPDMPCVKECQPDYSVSYYDDKRFGQEPYYVVGEEDMMAEIYSNGPIEVDFAGCLDLHQYTEGVYHTIFENDLCKGGHAVKALGWGVENGQKYWLLANSWGTSWGKLGGFFKFLRGVNHLKIESRGVAGLPRYSY